MAQRFYSDEEAEAILLAASQRSPTGGMTREGLLRAAAELGISPEQISEAEKSVRKQSEAAIAREEFRLHKRREFLEHLIIYAAVNLFLMFIDFGWTGHGSHWSLLVLFGWGIGIIAHAMEAFNPNGSNYSREFEKWNRKRKRRMKKAAEEE